MNQKFLIKAGSILSLADARYFSSRMVDIIGFCFDPSSANYIKPAEAQEIIKWIEGPKIAGEFSNQNVDEILNIMSVLQLDFLQWKADKPDKTLLDVDLPKIILVENEQAVKNLSSELNTERDYLMLDEEYFKSHPLMESFPVILNLSNNSALDPTVNVMSVAGINFELGPEIISGKKSYQDFDFLFELA